MTVSGGQAQAAGEELYESFSVPWKGESTKEI